MATKIPKMTLWYNPLSRSVRCTWTLKELGIDDKVEYKLVDIESTPHPPERAEFHKKVHPHNTVPALEIEGRPTMLESSAICLYLSDLCGKLAPSPSDRSEYYDWIMYAGSRLDEAMETLAMQWWFRPKDKWDAEVIAKAKGVADVCLDRVERTLNDKPYILGSELTTADCVLGFNIWWASFPEMNQGALMEGRPNVKAYLERIKARPALQATLAMIPPSDK